MLFSTDQGELATAVIGMWALGLYIILLFDRYLIRKISYKKLVAFQIVFLLLLPLLCLYVTKDIRINIETNKPYFIVVYSNKGLTKEDIPKKGLFDKSLTLRNDSVIFLNYSLKESEKFYVVEPNSWKGYKSKYLDTVINLNKVTIEVRSNDLSDEVRDSILKKLLPTLGLLQFGQTE